MKLRSTTIVIDAAILIAAVRGRSSGATLKAAERTWSRRTVWFRKHADGSSSD